MAEQILTLLDLPCYTTPETGQSLIFHSRVWTED